MNEELIFKENVKTIDKYIKSIKKEFPICRKGERKYLKLLRSNMYDYAISLGDKAVTASNLDTEFGSPKECATEYVQSLGTDTICTNMNGRKYGKYLFIAGLSVIAVLQYVYQLCCIRNGRYPGVLILHQLLLSFKIV